VIWADWGWSTGSAAPFFIYQDLPGLPMALRVSGRFDGLADVVAGCAGVEAGVVQQRDVQEVGVACRDRDGSSVALPEPDLGQDDLGRAAASLSVVGLQPFSTVASVRAIQADTDAAGSTSHPDRSQRRVAALTCGGDRNRAR
jgi:hypothetical protein